MLYERWLEVSSDRANLFALCETSSGRQWTFSQLRAEAEMAGIEGGREPIAFPHGNSANFIIEILQSWRTGRVVCPQEDATGNAKARIQLPPQNCIHLKTTSATTGVPRFVAFTESQLAADCDNIIATMGLRSDWPNLGAISLAHSYGFSNLVLPLLLHGIPLILVNSPLPEAMRRAAAGRNAITLPAVPALWRAWLEADAIPPETRLAISAGAPLPISLENEIWNRCHLKIHNFYGSTECGGIAFDSTVTPRVDSNYAGKPMSGVQLTVSPNNQLIVHGASVGETYWPTPDSVLGNARFETSDLAELQPEGVYLRGRATDIINIAGRKLAPESVEEILASHPGVRACVVFGIPSASAGREQEIAVWVQLASAGDTAISQDSESELRQFLLARLPAWQIPRHWRFVESLYTNQRGKLSRAEWRNRFLAT